MVAAGALVMLAMLSPVLYAFGDQVLSGNADMSPPLWRSSPRRHRSRSPSCCRTRTTALWGGAAAGAARSAGRATPTPIPKRSARCRWSALAVIAGAWWRAGWRSSRIRVGVTIFFVLLRSARSSTSPASTRRSRCPGACCATCRSSGLVRSPGRFAVLVDDGGRGALRAGARAPRPQPSRAAPRIALGRRRAPGDRAGARAAHALLRRRFPRSIRPSPRIRGPTSACSSCRSACGTAPASIGDFSARARSTSRRAHGKAHHRRLPVARVAEAPARCAARAGPERADAAQRRPGASRPNRTRAARGRADEFLRRDAPRLRGGRRERAPRRRSLDFAVDLLGLTLVSREGPMTLYVPRVPPPPDR